MGELDRDFMEAGELLDEMAFLLLKWWWYWELIPHVLPYVASGSNAIDLNIIAIGSSNHPAHSL